MYQELFNYLVENRKVTVHVNVSVSSLRKGLNKAKDIHNMNMQVLEEPTENRTITITANDDGTVTLELVTKEEVGHRFSPKFSFKIVEEDGDET